jgi:signal peptidase I
MSKSLPKRKSRAAEPSDSAASAHVAHVMKVQPLRETVESVAVAVVLAFLFRSFVAEAFVIPTGSMAPTLQGQHIDVECSECQLAYRANASQEVSQGKYVVETICPNCRYHLVIDSEKDRNHRSFTGDRILVSKFSYELGDPERWDVIVFKFPGNAKQNYIKRLVGLPNELIRIQHGDVHIAKRLFAVDTSESDSLLNAEFSEFLRERFEAVGHPLSAQVEVRPYLDGDLPDSHRSQVITGAWQIIDLESNRAYESRYRLSTTGEHLIEFFEPFEIARKPPSRSEPLLQLVYDTKFQSETLKRIGWPARWQPDDAGAGWKELDENGGYRLEEPQAPSMLRYRHCYATEAHWDFINEFDALPDEVSAGQLITDYYTYNDFAYSYRSAPGVFGPRDYNEDDRQGNDWVGDLAMEADVDIEGSAGNLLLDLVEGGVHFICQIDVATGEATLSRSDGGQFGEGGEYASNPSANTRVRGGRSFVIRYANVDDEIRLWVNAKLIEFNSSAKYEPRRLVRPTWSASDPGDLEPAGVGTDGATATFTRLQLFRDIYYVAVNDSSDHHGENSLDPTSALALYRSPQRWSQQRDFFDTRERVEFFVEDNCFMPLGDNSPASSDARLWDSVAYANGLDDNIGFHPYPYFERKYLIGKAVMIYWPHGWRTGVKFVPVPNVKRMGLIR